jgi:hypothetical protein
MRPHGRGGLTYTGSADAIQNGQPGKVRDEVASPPVPSHEAARRRGTRRITPLLGGLVVVGFAVLAGLFVLLHAERAAKAAAQGRRALLQAEKDLSAHQIATTRGDLNQASAAFARVHNEIHSVGPLRTVGEHIPFVRAQLRGAEAFADAGDLLTKGASNVTNAAAGVLDPPNQHLPLSQAVDALRQIRVALDQGIADIDAANARLVTLNGQRLIGPLDSARNQAAKELPVAERRAESADEGLAALIDFSGGNGPRRYLVLSQNPDEPRPTGGFIGTYGVISAASGHISLDRYASIESWDQAHPGTEIPPQQAPTAFKIPNPPVPQRLANVNATADWPAAAGLAMTMWQRGGEQPVDGVISITPEFLARVVGVLGPVAVPGYPDTVTSSNVVERIDYYTHVEAAALGANRKEFIVELARVVMQKLLDAPAATWDPLGRALSAGFDARESMAWSKQAVVQTAVTNRRWDGTLRATEGDFFYDGEFAYSAKNGRGLRRTFDHLVTVNPDGSGRVTTTVTIANTEPFSETTNLDSLSYLTFYGPAGATLVSSSLSPDASEPSLSDHPAEGWDLSAPPLGTTTLTFTWSVPKLAVRQADGTWRYQLSWMHLPGHTGDTLHLRVDIPSGWRWKGSPPAAAVPLEHDVMGSWTLGPAHGR